MVLTPRTTPFTRAIARVFAGFFFLCALAAPYAAYAEEGGEIFKDITFDVGLADLDQRTVTSGWMDIDLDGHLEPYWMGEAKLHYIKTTPDGYVMAEAVLSGMEDIPMEGANAQPAATLPIDVDRDGRSCCVGNSLPARGRKTVGPGWKITSVRDNEPCHRR